VRELLHRYLNSPAERLFAYVDKSVTQKDHLELAARLAQELPSSICRAGSAEGEEGIHTRLVRELLSSATTVLDLHVIASTANEPPADTGSSPGLFAQDPGVFSGDHYEDGPAEVEAHLSSLLEPGWVGARDPGRPEDEELEPASFGSGWHEDPGRVDEARAHCARALTRLVAFQRVPEALLATLCANLEPRHWFLKRGALYGTADLLRALIGALRLGHIGLEMYTRDVCDRLLRHLEVRRQKWLPFRSESRPADACEPLERVRFTLALLDAAAHFEDLRLLNAALKANDWHLQLLRSRGARRLEAARPVTAGSLQIHYLASLARQERMLQERFGS
jgi:hypothetical protein